MSSSRKGSPIRRREWFALGVTAVSVAALVGAGLFTNDDPDLAGRTTLARLSGEVANGVVAEWERLRRDPSWFEGETVLWASEAAPEFLQPVELRFTERANVAQALLIEARRLQREERDAAGALDTVLQALEKNPGEACRAQARLLAIQLLVQSEDLPAAADQWVMAREELGGAAAVEGTSVLLLCGLAAKPALGLEQRAAARDHLAGLWVAGSLALPAAGFEGDALREAYRARLQAMLPETSADRRLERSALAERARALSELVGAKPALPPSEGFGVLQLPEGQLIQRRREEGTTQGRVLAPHTVEGWLEAAVREAELLPSGFVLDLDGTQASEEALVRERATLSGGPLSFALHHSDPDAIISAVGRRGALLRAAFFALALGVAGAGFSVFRSLRRERHLAELKSTFVASVSHELRTPVASILLMAENLELERVSGKDTRQRYYRLIRSEAERLRQLVDDVLDFSRIERGKGVHLALADVSVPSFAELLEREARGRVVGAGGELHFTARDLPGQVRADSDALRRATMNLVDNALRHSGKDEVTLELHGAPDGGLVIAVRDRGRGVPTGRIESLFRPFERMESAEIDAVAGTGLGLAIVREIAEGHGGRAVARSPQGSGLLVELHIPSRPPEDTA